MHVLSRRHRLLAVGLLAAGLLAPAVPAGADPRNPSASDLRRAQQRVSAAQRAVADLQARAERAAEAYNGALVRVQHARSAQRAAQQQVATAELAYSDSLAVATAASQAASLAGQRADAARATRAEALAQAAAAQRALDQMARGAFQTDGKLGIVSQLFLAHDPLELASGRVLMNRVGVYQDKVIADAARDPAAAQAATDAAEAAEREATAAADTAATALDRASAARDAAGAAQVRATRAAAAASTAVREAAVARATALALVARAEAQLTHAVLSASALKKRAQEARDAAAGLDTGDAPSDAARTAIHWAFQEIGVPYSWGGGDENGPTRGFAQGANTVGFDCSGLTLFSYAKAGIHLDHWTGSQWHVGRRISSMRDVLPGDLLFFAYDTNDDSTIHHVALYIGKGKMIEAPYTGEVVRVTSAYRDDFIGATRPWQQ